MTSTPSGARSPVEMLSGCTVAMRALTESSSGVCSGGVLMFGPRGISMRSASSGSAGAKMWTSSMYGFSSGIGSSSGASPYSRGSAIFPLSIDTAATAGDLLDRHDVVGVVGLGDQRAELGQVDLDAVVVFAAVVGADLREVVLALL